MAWLHTSLIGQQTLKDGGRNSGRKGFSLNNTDPDKSDTPLLHDANQSLDKETIDAIWSTDSSEEKSLKSSSAQNAPSKTGFFGCSIFDRSGAKNKSQPDPNRPSSQTGKVTENKTLLSHSSKEQSQNFNFDDDDDDSDSEDEWCFPQTGGYQRVKPSVD